MADFFSNASKFLGANPLVGLMMFAGINLISSLGSSAIQGIQASKFRKEGKELQQYGMQGMEELIEQRRQAYDNLFNIVYRGVSKSGNGKLSGGAGYGFTQKGTNYIDPRINASMGSSIM